MRIVERVLSRLTYANVVATLALVLAVGGTAYAAGLPRNSVGTKQVKDFSLRLQDMGGRVHRGTATISSNFNVTGCDARDLGTQENPIRRPGRVLGSLVVGHLTDPQGEAVLDNGGVVLPSVISETSQGGFELHLVVCHESATTVPAGSVFHYRIIGPK